MGMMVLRIAAAMTMSVGDSDQEYFMRFKLMEPVVRTVFSDVPSEQITQPSTSVPPTPTPTIEPDHASPTVAVPRSTDPTDVADPADPLPESQVGSSTENGSRGVGYQSPSTMPRPGQGCEGRTVRIGDASAAAMNQNVSFWSLGFSGFLVRFSVWRIRNANLLPVTVQLEGGLFSSKTVLVPARSDVIAYSLAIGWTGEHRLRLYRGGRWVLIDRKVPVSASYSGC